MAITEARSRLTKELSSFIVGDTISIVMNYVDQIIVDTIINNDILFYMYPLIAEDYHTPIIDTDDDDNAYFMERLDHYKLKYIHLGGSGELVTLCSTHHEDHMLFNGSIIRVSVDGTCVFVSYDFYQDPDLKCSTSFTHDNITRVGLYRDYCDRPAIMIESADREYTGYLLVFVNHEHKFHVEKLHYVPEEKIPCYTYDGTYHHMNFIIPNQHTSRVMITRGTATGVVVVNETFEFEKHIQLRFTNTHMLLFDSKNNSYSIISKTNIFLHMMRKKYNNMCLSM